MEYIFIVLLFFIFVLFWISGFGNIIEKFSIRFQGNDINIGGGITFPNMCSINPPISPPGTVCFALFNNTSNTSITINGSDSIKYTININQNDFKWIELDDTNFPITIPLLGTGSISLHIINSAKYPVITKNLLNDVPIIYNINSGEHPVIKNSQIIHNIYSDPINNKGNFKICNITKKLLAVTDYKKILKPLIDTSILKINNITVSNINVTIKLNDLDIGFGYIFIIETDSGLTYRVIDIYKKLCINPANPPSPTPPPSPLPTPQQTPTTCENYPYSDIEGNRLLLSNVPTEINITKWDTANFNTNGTNICGKQISGDHKGDYKACPQGGPDDGWIVKQDGYTNGCPANMNRCYFNQGAAISQLCIKLPTPPSPPSPINCSFEDHIYTEYNCSHINDSKTICQYINEHNKHAYGKYNDGYYECISNNDKCVKGKKCKNNPPSPTPPSPPSPTPTPTPIPPTPPSPPSTMKTYFTCKNNKCINYNYDNSKCNNPPNLHKSASECHSNCIKPSLSPPPPIDPKYPACNNPWPDNYCHKGQSCLTTSGSDTTGRPLNKYTFRCGTQTKLQCTEDNMHWCDNASNTPDPQTVANKTKSSKNIDIELINYKQEPIYVYIRSQDSFKGNPGVNTNFINKNNASIITASGEDVYRIKLNAFGTQNDTFNSSMISTTKPSSTDIYNFKSVIIWTYPVNGKAIVDGYNPVNGPYAGNLIGEFSITDNNIYYDLSAVDGVDKGMTFQYIDSDNKFNPNTKCLLLEEPPDNIKTKFMSKKLYGYSSILSDKWKLGGDEGNKSCNEHTRCNPQTKTVQICPNGSECPKYSASECYIDHATGNQVCCCGGPATKSNTNTAVLNMGLIETDINKWIKDSKNPYFTDSITFKYSSTDNDNKISQNVNILRNLGFALPNPAKNLQDAKKSLENIISGTDWFQGCPGGRTKSTVGKFIHNIFSDRRVGLADNIVGQHNCRVYYYWKYIEPDSYSGWLKKSKCMGYTWAMDEFECVDENTSSTSTHTSGKPPNYLNSASGICGYLYDKSTPDIPSIDDMFDNDWGCSNTSVCSSDYNLPATSCGQTTKTIPLKDESLKRYWEKTKGCREKEVAGQKTNPSPTRNGGKIVVTFHDLCWLQDLENNKL